MYESTLSHQIKGQSNGKRYRNKKFGKLPLLGRNGEAEDDDGIRYTLCARVHARRKGKWDWLALCHFDISNITRTISNIIARQTRQFYYWPNQRDNADTGQTRRTIKEIRKRLREERIAVKCRLKSPKKASGGWSTTAIL